MRWFVSLLLLLTGAVSAADPQTQTFTDDLGRTVTVPLHPQRIVSMHDLDITIPLIELGAPPIASHGRTRPDGSHICAPAPSSPVSISITAISALLAPPISIWKRWLPSGRI